MVHLVLSEKILYWLTSSVVMWCNIYNMSCSHTSKQACLLFHFNAKCWFQGGQGSFRSHHGKAPCQKCEMLVFMHLLETATLPPFSFSFSKTLEYFFHINCIKTCSRKTNGLPITWMIYGSAAVMKASW